MIGPAMTTSAQRIIGSYRLLHPLGRGGMATVFSAEHLETGARAAVKLVETPGAPMVQAIRREIHALARLSHPGIVGILADGMVRGMPWCAMELFEGDTLGIHIDRLFGRTPEAATASGTTRANVDAIAPTAELPMSAAVPADPATPELGPRPRPAAAGGRLKETLTLVRRLCEPLRYLHGEGLVHRDLKPANVVVGPGNQPRLIDFGLSQPFTGALAREQLEIAGMASGTVSYMAPEQARGELVDARADIYSLGCILYELLTGRTPFVGSDVHTVLWQHMTRTADPPSRHADGIDADLDALVLRLLDKEPRRRPGYADDVAREIVRLGAEDAPTTRAPLPLRSYLYRPPMVGRIAVLDRIDGAIARLNDAGRGGVILLAGESGVGRTRLLVEISSRAVRRRTIVLTGSCDGVTRTPLAGFRGALRAIADRCREAGTSETRRLLGRRAALLAEVHPELGQLPGLVPDERPVELPGKAGALRLTSYMVETLEALGRQEPVVLLMDDLQWADELTLTLLGDLARVLPMGPARVLLVGSFRAEEEPSEIARLRESLAVETIAVGRLAPEEVAEMTAAMLALPRAPEALAAFLAEASRGNPFFVAEYLRAAVELGQLARIDGEWRVTGADRDDLAAAVPLPRSLEELVRRRLDGLTAGARRIVDAAAVLGPEGHHRTLARTAAMEDAEALEATQELISRSLMEEAGPFLRFAHHRARAVAYDAIPADHRRVLHRQAALAIESSVELGGTPDGIVADHWRAAGDPARALPIYLKAARRAARSGAHAEADRLYGRYLELAPVTPDRVAALNELGHDVLQLRGRQRDAEHVHTEALEAARTLGDGGGEIDALHGLAWLHHVTGRRAEARALFEQAGTRAAELGDDARGARVLGGLAALLREEHSAVEAKAAYERTIAIHRRTGDRRNAAIHTGNLANLLFEEGRIDEAQALHERALAIHREVGDRRNEGIRLGNLANLHFARGRVDEARDLMLLALVIHREVGDRRGEAVFLLNLGLLEKSLGRLTEAGRWLNDTLRIHREIGDPRGETTALANIAEIHAATDQSERAREIYEQALAVARGAGLRRIEGRARGDLASLVRRQGRPDQALPMYEEALDIARQSEDRRSEGIWLGGIAACLRLLGKPGDLAESLAHQGLELLADIDPIEHVLALCGHGHIDLAGGRSAAAALERAEEVARETHAGPDSELGAALRALRAAQDSFERGATLLAGECPDAMAPSLRDWARKHRRAAR